MEVIGSVISVGVIPLFIIGCLVWLFVKVNTQQRKIYDLESNVRDLENRFSWLRTRESSTDPAPEIKTDTAPKAEEIRKTEQSQTRAAAQTSNAAHLSEGQNYLKADPNETMSWEKLLSVNWLVWVGGVALAFGGIFIVKFSIDNNLLGPWSRILIGTFLGLIMMAAGEWFRRQPEYLKNLTSWQYLPLAVSGAGLMTIYGAVYSGFAFYDLYPPIIAIVLLSMTAAAGLAYSLLLGPLMAAVSLVGAYAVPILVATADPSTELLFLYLFAVLVGSLSILRFRPWHWLGTSNLCASALWVFLWYIIGGNNEVDALVVEIYLAFLLSTYIFIFVAGNTEASSVASILPRWSEILDGKSPQFQIYVSFLYTAIASLLIAIAFDHSTLAILLVLFLSPLAVFVASRGSANEGLVILSHASGLLLLLSWPGSLLATTFDPTYSPVLTDNAEIIRFLTSALLIGIYYVAFGYYRIVKGYFAALGAVHAVAGPILIFCISYWRFNGLGTAPEWALIAIAFSGAYAGVATLVGKKDDKFTDDMLLAIFAIGSTAALSLAFTVALENEWLSIALALQVAATAWIYRKIPISAFRFFSAILTATVIIRLELGGEVIRLIENPGVDAEGYLLGLVIAIIAFGVAWAFFRKDKTDYLVLLLESGMVLLWTTMIALGIRTMTGVGLISVPTNVYRFSGNISFAEISIHTASLLTSALALYWLNKRNPTIIRELSWIILGMIGVIMLALGSLVKFNPFISQTGNVGTWYVLDWLFVAYLIPAALLIIFNVIAKPEHTKIGRIGTIVAGILAFFYLNAEIRHFFVGSDIRLNHVSNPELYTYSLVWLIFASILMWVGILRDNQLLRQGAILLLLATVGKVFVIDMSALDGLLRAVSFLGLGICLIGIGFLYQRFGKKETATS